MLGFLVQMTPFQVQSFRGAGDVVLLALEFGKDDVALESLHAIGERAGAGC